MVMCCVVVEYQKWKSRFCIIIELEIYLDETKTNIFDCCLYFIFITGYMAFALFIYEMRNNILMMKKVLNIK